MTRCATFCDNRGVEHKGMCVQHVTSVIGTTGAAVGFTVESMGRNRPSLPVFTAGAGESLTRIILDWSDVATLIESMIKAQMRHSPADVLKDLNTKT